MMALPIQFYGGVVLSLVLATLVYFNARVVLHLWEDRAFALTRMYLVKQAARAFGVVLAGAAVFAVFEPLVAVMRLYPSSFVAWLVPFDPNLLVYVGNNLLFASIAYLMYRIHRIMQKPAGGIDVEE